MRSAGESRARMPPWRGAARRSSPFGRGGARGGRRGRPGLLHPHEPADVPAEQPLPHERWPGQRDALRLLRAPGPRLRRGHLRGRQGHRAHPEGRRGHRLQLLPDPPPRPGVHCLR